MLFTMKEDEVADIIRGRKNFGLSITDLVNLSGLSRSAVRIILARLEGARKVKIRNVGMAKIYLWSDEGSKEEKGHVT